MYISLPIDDFMSHTSFIFGKIGIAVGPLIMDMSEDIKKGSYGEKEEEELKSIFLNRVLMEIPHIPTLEIKILNNKKYYMIEMNGYI